MSTGDVEIVLRIATQCLELLLVHKPHRLQILFGPEELVVVDLVEVYSWHSVLTICVVTDYWLQPT